MVAQSEKDSTHSFSPPPFATPGRGRVWRYGPPLLWCGFIFYASTGALAASNTSRIIRPLLLWLFPHITEAALLEAHFLVRKAAHFTEYAILALLFARAFLSSSRALLARRWWVASLAFVAAYALLDEYHQSFVATRTASINDSLIDTTGGAWALLCLFFWRAYRRRKN